MALVGPTSKEPTVVGFRVLFLPEASAGLDRNADGRITLDELAPPPAALGGPVVDATKRDTLVVDNDSDTQADPGDIVIADHDGVVVLDPASAIDRLTAAREVMAAFRSPSL